MSKNKIKILLVDDNKGFLQNIVDGIELDSSYDSELEPICFGEDVGEIRDEDVGASFIKYIKANQDRYIADVIFCDFALGSDIRALEVLKEVSSIASIPPIVVMTANRDSLFQEGVASIEAGAKGYIIKSDEKMDIDEVRKAFLQEVLITAVRVLAESEQRKIHQIIAEVSKRYDKTQKTTIIKKVQTLAEYFTEIFSKYYPYHTVIIREYRGGNLELIASSIQEKRIRESIQSLKVDDVEILRDLISSKDGININIDMPPLYIDEVIKDVIRQLNLQKGVMIRIGDSTIPLGSVSIFCHEPQKSFDTKSIDNFKIAINSIYRDWKLINSNQKRGKVLKFIEEIMQESDIDTIWSKLCELIHEHYNQDSHGTKTTIKVVDILSNKLTHKGCSGADCEVQKPVSIDANNISAWVYRNNHFCIVDRDGFVEPNANKKRLTDAFKESLTTGKADKNIEFFTTNDEMMSELCLPIEFEDKPIGVLNLESNKDYAYPRDKNSENQEILKNIQSLLNITVKRVKNLEQQNFMSDMTNVISKDRYKERFDGARKFLEIFVGYSNFSVFIKEKNSLKLEYFTFNPSSNKIVDEKLLKKIEQVATNSAILDFIDQDKIYSYIEDSSTSSSFKTLPELESKAQFISKLIYKDEALGVVNIEFDRINPLTQSKIEIVQKFVAWLGRDIKENIKNKHLKDKVKYLTERNTIDSLFRNLSHAMGTPVNTVKSNLEVLSDLYDEMSQTEIKEKLNDSMYILHTIANYPKRYISSADYGYGSLQNVYDAVYGDLSLKIQEVKKQRDIEIHVDIEPLSISSKQTSRLYLLFFHPMLNALEESSVTQIDIDAKKQSNGMLKIVIQDNGKGFRDEQLNKQTKNVTTKSDGGGFGLYYIEQIIKYELSGEIKYSNHNGAIVTICIPIKSIGEKDV